MLIVDEGWLALDDPGFAGQLREWLKSVPHYSDWLLAAVPAGHTLAEKPNVSWDALRNEIYSGAGMGGESGGSRVVRFVPKTLRKENASVVFATQSLADILSAFETQRGFPVGYLNHRGRKERR